MRTQWEHSLLSSVQLNEDEVKIKSAVLTDRNKKVGVALGTDGKVYLYRRGDYDNKGTLKGKFEDISRILGSIQYSGTVYKTNAVYYLAAYSYGKAEADDLGYSQKDIQTVHKAIDDFAKTMNESINEGYSDREKLVGDQYRVTWNKYGNGYKVEELPAKGKKRLTVATIDLGRVHAGIIIDVIEKANLDKNDSVKEVMDKILKSAQKQAEDRDPDGWWNPSMKWYIDEVSPLKVEPEGLEPVSAQAKDFEVNSSWKSFGAYSPDSDLQQSDPYYSKIVNSSDVAARKLYRLLRADSSVLKNVSWSEFSKWLTNNGINYKYQHSVWH